MISVISSSMKTSAYLTWIFTLLSLLIISPQPVIAASPTSFSSLGYRWTIESSSDGKPKRIFDLSYPDFFGDIRLGKVVPDLDLSEVKKLLLGAATHPGALSSIQEAINIIDQASVRGGTQKVFPKQWWASVPWKSALRAQAHLAPSSFRLGDIDWVATATSSASSTLLEAKLENIDRSFRKLSGSSVPFLDAFKFEQQSDGSYDIFYAASDIPGANTGKKIVDFDSSMAGFWESVEIELLNDAIGQALGLIPVPVLSAVLATVSDRFFHALNLLMASRQQMAIEMLSLPHTEGVDSAWSVLNENLQEDAAKYIMWSQTSILGALKWIFKKPLTQFQEDQAIERNKSLENAQWFSSQASLGGWSLQTLNPRFLSVRSEKMSGIFLLATTPYDLLGIITSPNSEGPPVAVNYLHPGQLAKERFWFDVLATTVNFATHLMPNGGVLNGAFKTLLEKNVDRLKKWEARLLAHLKERESKGESWTQEIRELEAQRVNPLDISDQRQARLIEARKKSLGIRLE